MAVVIIDFNSKSNSLVFLGYEFLFRTCTYAISLLVPFVRCHYPNTLRQNNSATCADLATSECAVPKKLCNLRGLGDQRVRRAKKTLQLARI